MNPHAPFLLMAVMLTLGLAPAQALTPLPQCEGTESGMSTFQLFTLDTDGASSGVTVESYQIQMKPDNSPEGVFKPLPGPVGVLDGFFGIRVVHCASGYFHAIDTRSRPDAVVAALGATEQLRAAVKGGKAIARNDLAAAVRAVYGKQIMLRETAETCGCNAIFPRLRPKGMTPYGDRTDTTN